MKEQNREEVQLNVLKDVYINTDFEYKKSLKEINFNKIKSMLHSDILCPYCLEELRSRNLKRVCELCREPEDRPWPKMLTGRAPRCRQPGCHGKLSDRVCNFCGRKLPSDILDYEKYLGFSLLGTAGAGKTNFLTTMLHELMHAQSSPLVLSPMEPNSTMIFRENEDTVYERRHPTAPTPIGITPPPQLWKIKDKRRMTDTKIPSYCMTIFDGAGEDCRHIDPVISRYINGSKVLVILIDPLALPGVRKEVPEDILTWSTTVANDADASVDMVNQLADYVRKNCGLKADSLIDRDVAIVFTKIDVVQDHFGRAAVMQPSPHLRRGGFVKEDADAVNEEIRDWLIRYGEMAFIDAVETSFRKERIRYFGISSFGQPPTGDRQLGGVIPHRVLDPVFWMLSKEEIVPVI